MKTSDLTLFHEKCFVNGEWVVSNSGKTVDVHCPADGSYIGKVPMMTAEETGQVIKYAKNAWNLWKNMPVSERGKSLMRWHDLIMDNLEELATILTWEEGKTLVDATNEIKQGASYLPWYIGEAGRHYGHVIPSIRKGMQPITYFQPIGIAAAITPWNFPSSMIMRKSAPALAAGCVMIVRPARYTPFSALALAALAEKAGIPAGVFQVITGDASEIGDVFCNSYDVRALSFTGSTEVGELLMSKCSKTLKKLSMELGGNAPCLVYADANIERTAEVISKFKFRNAGQLCICINRLFIHKDIISELTQKLVDKISTIKLGNALDPSVTMGPLIDEHEANRVQALVDDAVQKGAKVLLGGKKSPLGFGFFEPTVITGVRPGMKVYDNEIFGPVLSIIEFNDNDDVIAMANDTRFGLGSYIFSENINRIWNDAKRLDFGMVGVNECTLGSPEVPFGGIKISGLGREGGDLGIEEYTEAKYVLIGGLGK